MSTVVTTAEPEVVGENRVVKRVSWETYEQILCEHESRSAPRFTFDNGELEIYMPSQPHEEIAELLKTLVFTIAQERRVKIRALGSTTFKKQSDNKGVEPDGCFYVRNFAAVRGLQKIDLTIHPPPDLVIEVDFTNPSINRFPIYAAFGVNEIWRYLKNEIKIFVLHQGDYRAVAESAAFPCVTTHVLTDFAQPQRAADLLELADDVREWARQHQI